MKNTAVQKLISLSLSHSDSADNGQTIISLSDSERLPDNNIRLNLRFIFTFTFTLFGSQGFEIGFCIHKISKTLVIFWVLGLFGQALLLVVLLSHQSILRVLPNSQNPRNPHSPPSSQPHPHIMHPIMYHVLHHVMHHVMHDGMHHVMHHVMHHILPRYSSYYA